MAPRIKDLALLSPLWRRSLPWCGLDPWPQYFHMLWRKPKRKNTHTHAQTKIAQWLNVEIAAISPCPQQRTLCILPWVMQIFFPSFWLFRASPTAYGGSQARDLIGAMASATAPAMWDLRCLCDLYHSSQPCQILNPRSKARDGTCNLMVPGWIHFHCATMGAPCYANFLM